MGAYLCRTIGRPAVGIAKGTLVRVGSVVRSAEAGQIIKHLREPQQ